MTFFKIYTIILKEGQDTFTICSSHLQICSVSIQGYNIKVPIGITTPVLLTFKPKYVLYDPIKIQGIDSDDIKPNTMIINTLPFGEFPHASYGIIFSDPNTSLNSNRICGRHTRNEYFLDFEVKLVELETNTCINHNSITFQVLIETY